MQESPTKTTTLTTGEAAQWCGVSFRTVLRWIQQGILPAYKLPGRGDHRILVEDFIAFLQRHQIPLPKQLATPSNRILVVEDDEAEARVLSEFLAKAGYETKIAGDGFTAGALAVAFAPVLITVDLNMPGLHGEDLIRLVRALPPLAAVKILVVSGMDPETLQSAVHAGADAALAKPVRWAQLVETVNRLLGRVPAEPART
jgi:excisionase family DNA binding protein